MPFKTLLKLEPTFKGYLEDSKDALLLVEACLQGKPHHIPRRPRYGEVKDVIRGSDISVYMAIATGHEDWNDGKSWRPFGC